MFQNALTGFKAQIQTIKLRVTLFQPVHHAQTLQIVLKASVIGHAFIQHVLARMTKRRVPQVVPEPTISPD